MNKKWNKRQMWGHRIFPSPEESTRIRIIRVSNSAIYVVTILTWKQRCSFTKIIYPHCIIHFSTPVTTKHFSQSLINVGKPGPSEVSVILVRQKLLYLKWPVTACPGNIMGEIKLSINELKSLWFLFESSKLVGLSILTVKGKMIYKWQFIIYK